MDKKFLTSFAGLLAFVYYINLFFFRDPTPSYFIAIFLGIQAYLVFVFRHNIKKITKSFSFITVLVISVLTSLIAITRSYYVVQNIFGIIMFGNTILLAYIASTGSKDFSSLAELVFSPLKVVAAYVYAPIRAMTLSKQQNPIANKNIGDIQVKPGTIFATLFGLGLATLVAYLLAQADPAYAKLLERIFNVEVGIVMQRRTALSLLFFVLFAPFLFLRATKFSVSPVRSIKPAISSVAIVMSMLAVIMTSYLFTQANYLFADAVEGKKLVQEIGLTTYSEYVTKGFAELPIVTVILYSIVWLAVLALRNAKNEVTYFTYLTYSLIGLLSVFVLSIFRRIYLYQYFHGLSLPRIYGFIFLIWLSGMIATVAGRVWKPNKHWVKAEIIFSVVILVLVGFWNTEQTIARLNPPTVNERIDYIYLSRLSPDAMDGWDKALEFANKVLLESKDDYLEDGVIDEYERRQIAYAATVVSNIAHKSINLVSDHSDTSKEDVQKILKNSQLLAVDNNTKVLPIIDKKILKEEEAIANRDPFSKLTQQQIDEAQRKIDRLREIKTALVNQNTIATQSAEVDEKNLYVDYSSGRRIIKPNLTCGYYNTCSTNFVTVSSSDINSYSDNRSSDLVKVREANKTNSLGRLLRFNTKEMAAYNEYKDFLYSKEYKELQTAFTDYTVIIMNQDESEQSVNVDISLSGAFVDW